MADQVEIYLPKTVINEGSQLTATVRFRTRASAAASIPTNVYYKLTNVSTGETISDWKSVTAAAEVSITLTPTENTIRDKSHVKERIEFLVAADYGLSTQAIGLKHYKIVDLQGYG